MMIWPAAVFMATGMLLIGGAGYTSIAGWWQAERDAVADQMLNTVLNNDVARLTIQTDEQRRLLRAAGVALAAKCHGEPPPLPEGAP